jgi:hypothetical protein
MAVEFNRFFVCLLDVLGFESKFKQLGLEGMLEKYLQLIHVVDSRNKRTEDLFELMNFSESAYWTSEGDGFVFLRMYGAYASDSIILFAHADFPENRYPQILEINNEERKCRASDPASGWMYQTAPCDTFLDLCNEVVCRSIEIGLPLRGALSMGEAVLHLDRGIYLGDPLIEAARLEKPQQCIGVSMGRSFMDQVVPSRYKIEHTRHFKGDVVPNQYGGTVLDWPRHWKKTRKETLDATISAMDTDPRFSDYYAKTREIVEMSDALADMYTGPEHTLITKVYPQFSGAELKLNARAVRHA